MVCDAVGSIDKHEANLALRKMKAKGAKLIETKSLAGVSHLRQAGVDGEGRKERTGKAVKIVTQY